MARKPIISHRSNTYERGVAEAQSGTMEVMAKRLREDAIPSFDYAWNELKEGKPNRFLLKTGSVGLGAVLATDGVYHLLAGYDEEVDDMFLERQTGRNHVRMFAGAVELFAGVAAMYAGLTKGPRVVGFE
jgi:hypothetical protein